MMVHNETNYYSEIFAQIYLLKFAALHSSAPIHFGIRIERLFQLYLIKDTGALGGNQGPFPLPKINN